MTNNPEAMKNILVSIIMPVYNSEQYLKEAIESVLNQSYQNFELILIDDGSSDKSPIICESFKEKDVRVRVIHKDNGGVCSARNLGLDNARGEYVAFIDNDDTYTKNCLIALMELVDGQHIDIVKCGRKNILITPELKVLNQKVMTFSEDRIYEYDQFISMYRNIKDTECFNSVWNGIYRTSFLRDNNMRFREDVKHGNEDLIFNYSALLLRPMIAVSSKVLYTHYYRISHSTSTKFYEDQIETRIQAIELERKLMYLGTSQEDIQAVEFDEIRECFRILAQCNDKAIRKQQTLKIQSNIVSDYCWPMCVYRKLNGKQKLDWFLLKHKLYSSYFSYKKMQRFFQKR